jgi:predicted TIM-barrel fold metal-dependent hydrolase
MRHDYRILDADAHVMEPEGMWAEYVAPEYRPRAPLAPGGNIWIRVEGLWMPVLWDDEVAERLRPFAMEATRHRPDGPYGTAAARRFDAVSQLDAMEREGIDQCVVYPTQGLYVTAIEGMDPAFAAALCRAYNTWVAGFCGAAAGRIRAAALVSLHDVASAVAEARHAVGTLGLGAVLVRPNRHAGRNLDDPSYEPLWAAVEELNVPLAVHEGTGARLPVTGAERFRGSVLLQHATSHPLEMMCAAAALICGGVLERHPRLRVAFLEAGASWLPYWLWRLDEHVEWLGGREAPRLALRPSEYFRRQCFASVECDEAPLAHTIAAIGDDCLVFASDYPHPDAKYPRAVDTFLGLPGLSDASRRKLLWDNPRRLYGR